MPMLGFPKRSMLAASNVGSGGGGGGTDYTNGGTINGNLVITGTVNTGAATLASAAVTGAATVGTTLGVTGATTVAAITASGTLTSEGTATLNTVTGNTSTGGVAILVGNVRIAPTTKTNNYTLTGSDGHVAFNGTSLTATLPASPSNGQSYWIKNKHTTSLAMGVNGKLVDGAGSYSVSAGVGVFFIYDSTLGSWSTF